jgi:hypothetical protein
MPREYQANTTYTRSSHSVCSVLMKRVRSLAYRNRTSESSIIECALWLFFKNKSDVSVLDMMDRAGIAPRRRKSVHH